MTIASITNPGACAEAPPVRHSPASAAALLPVVLCGGAGTRLWPLSREHYPKQLLPLIGDDTMLQSTVRRVENMAGLEGEVLPPLVICNEEYRFLIAQQLGAGGRAAGAILLEPCGRNTAPALTLAALLSGRDEGPEPVMLAMPADHLVADTGAFHDAVRRAHGLAAAGRIVTFGIVPTSAEPGYGYIRAGEPIAGASGALEVAAFVEKPDRQTAHSYVKSGGYLWNSGIFLVRPSVWLAAIGRHRPDILAACREAAAGLSRDRDFMRIDNEAFARCPADSIDYAVMEKLGRGAAQAAVVVALAAGWSDMGAWDAIWNACQKDGQGNVERGDVMSSGTRDSLLLSGGRLLACVGLQDVVVVETPDVVLVADRRQTQEVKVIVEQLREQGRNERLSHRKVHRPWGSYDSVDQGDRFQVKRIVVHCGAALSLQMHHHRAEHWIVVKGTAQVTRGEETFLLAENQSTYIPPGVTHRLANPGKIPLELIEVQSGGYLGEDDIVRFDDRYGRAAG
jgi:mannose-1-phosphate guanylyltransferase / mannose-6-phosphate isomerase